MDRVAIVSSPRSGNTWLRHIVRDSLRVPELAVHNYSDVGAVPDRCVLQLHWYREPNFQSFLRTNRFRVISLARHPLDTLLSVLHFIRHEPDTARWLGGNCELPMALIGKSSSSTEFLNYALSFGAENLLSVTYQWWHDPAAIKVRYEDLVNDGPTQVSAIATQLGSEIGAFRAAYYSTSFATLRNTPNRHGWQGKSGLWKRLIPEEHASRIAAHHGHLMKNLGYTVVATGVSTKEAEANWIELTR